MTNTGADDLNWGELAELNELEMKRSLRKAIRRGIIRTAFLGAVIFFVGSIVLFIGASLLRSALGTSGELERVAAVGWQVAHPNFVAQQTSASTGGWTSSETLSVAPILAQSSGSTTSIRLTENPWGDVSAPLGQLNAPSDAAISGLGSPTSIGPAVKSRERKVLNSLPAAVDVASVVEFATPMDDNAWLSFLQQYPPGPENPITPFAQVLLSRADQEFEFRGGQLMQSVYGWGSTAHFSPKHSDINAPVTDFQDWVASLHSSDRGALEAVGADLDRLRAAAKDGHIYGFILPNASVRFLTKLLKDPAVGAVHPYDVAFNVQS